MSEHKNSVNDLSELKGWRKPGEELQYLQGALLDNLNDSKRGNLFVDAIYIVSIPLCASGIMAITNYFMSEFHAMEIFDIVLFFVILLVLIAWCVFSIKGFANSLFPTEGKYIKLVKAGDFSVCDATIRDVHYLYRNDARDIMMANLSDKQGNYCNQSIRCDWTRWLTIGSHVYLTCYEIEQGKYFYKIYPSISCGENAEAGTYGMKLYHKHVIKKECSISVGLKRLLTVLFIGFMCLSLIGGFGDIANYISGRYAQIDATIIYVHNYTSDDTQHANGYITWEHNGVRFTNEDDGHYMDFKSDAKVGDKKVIWIDTQTGNFESEDGILSSITMVLAVALIEIYVFRKFYFMIMEK